MTEELSPEQLEARREEMKQFYEKSLPYLEAQAKYEKLLTDVEESRYKRASMQFQYANMMSSIQPDLDEDERENFQPQTKTQHKPIPEVSAEGKKLRKS